MSKPKYFKQNKTVQAVNFFLNQDSTKTMSKMKLLKLLWLADRYTMRNYGYSITHDDYYALLHGPIGTSTKDILDGDTKDAYIDQYIKVVSGREIKSITPTDFDEFSEIDISTLRMIQSVYGKVDTYELRRYTHQFPEWKRFEKEIKTRGGSYKMKVEDFFKNPEATLRRTVFTEDESVLGLNEEVFKEELSLQQLLG